MGLGWKDDEKPHVLAVDDSLVDRKIIEKLLTNSACKVTTSENAHGALELLGLKIQEGDQSTACFFYLTLRFNACVLQVSNVNMIITDYSMPGMTGYELLKKIKDSPTVKEIPVVVVSSEDIPTRIEKCLEEGAEEFFLKPLRQSDVIKLQCRLKEFGNPSDEGEDDLYKDI
ncbi:two-component response regulator ARR17-like [Malus sylvestris]|uniref:two-component response regulator ARR17-like n=1 Tax=Malus sylvestris TaxID=3752 RepID=UPI0021ABD31C|nr:two-component response regulator ARR17-like [Malus sylvestris]